MQLLTRRVQPRARQGAERRRGAASEHWIVLGSGGGGTPLLPAPALTVLRVAALPFLQEPVGCFDARRTSSCTPCERLLSSGRPETVCAVVARLFWISRRESVCSISVLGDFFIISGLTEEPTCTLRSTS